MSYEEIQNEKKNFTSDGIKLFDGMISKPMDNEQFSTKCLRKF